MTEPILTSPHNPTVKHLVRMRDNRARRREAVVLVDGWRETRRGLEAGLQPLGVYAPPEPSADLSPAGDDPSIDAAETWVRENASRWLRFVGPAVMNKIAYGQSERGVVALFQAPDRTLKTLSDPPSRLILVLDDFEKPGNLGAAFRSADAAGAGAVILTPNTADPLNPNAIRSSLGTVFRVPFAVADQTQARQWLAKRNYRIFAARVESSKPLWGCDFVGPTAIVIGSEAKGLGDRWVGDAESESIQAVRIPMAGSVDSLNASVSAAVLLYEAKRQRTGNG